jgi:hypothetical protein
MDSVCDVHGWVSSRRVSAKSLAKGNRLQLRHVLHSCTISIFNRFELCTFSVNKVHDKYDFSGSKVNHIQQFGKFARADGDRWHRLFHRQNVKGWIRCQPSAEDFCRSVPQANSGRAASGRMRECTGRSKAPAIKQSVVSQWIFRPRELPQLVPPLDANRVLTIAKSLGDAESNHAIRRRKGNT